MNVEFLIGAAGSGKTFACLEQVRAALKGTPKGLPLIFLAPKQATFQLERELLIDPELSGFTRLQILSFDRLADYVLHECFTATPTLLTEQGRVMVLRAILARESAKLQTFAASARMPGFAQELSRVLQDLQWNKITPSQLRIAGERQQGSGPFAGKLLDIALILESYLVWLKENALFDPKSLLDLAAEAIQANEEFRIEQLWLDGFAEMTLQETALLTAILPKCNAATLAFCLPDVPAPGREWKLWSVPARTFRRCFDAACQISTPRIRRLSYANRFSKNRVLAHLESQWAEPGIPCTLGVPDVLVAGQLDLFAAAHRPPGFSETELGESIEWFQCANPETEATLAAREILKLVRDRGGRFREAAVLVRRLEPYQAVLQRIFRRYGIPFFVDQRRSVAHHPLAELTRYALRTVAFGWRLDDWFGALKCGLIDAEEGALDRLEIEAIAHGWEGDAWLTELRIQHDSAKAAPYEAIRKQVLPPFMRLRANLFPTSRRTVNGVSLCAAIRVLWDDLGVEATLSGWAESATDEPSRQVHQTVWTEIDQWLDNVLLAFPGTELPIEEWLAILEAGLSTLSVGVVPPALDQVLIGAVDRSRNPTLRLAVVLGMNEGVFPAVPTGTGLLTDSDRELLSGRGLFLGPDSREQLAHERYLGYMACTRARERLVLTSAYFDALGRPLNPSSFLSHLQRLFRGFKPKDWRLPPGWAEAEHPVELISKLISPQPAEPFASLAALPVFGRARQRLQHFRNVRPDECLSAAMARKVYGPELRTSITRLERFAECQFRFFVAEGLRASEKRTFELDPRKLGDFQHQVLKAFHQQLEGDNKRWRDLAPMEARQVIGRIAREHARKYHNGLFDADEQDRFTAQQLSVALEEMIEVLVGWMDRYAFDPAAAELRFDDRGAIPPLRLALSEGRSLALNGSIDRVDILRTPTGSEAWCVVIDYKSSSRKPDAILMRHGIQMQPPAYLSVLEQLAAPESVFGVKKLVPAGFFYISLRRDNPSHPHRRKFFAEVKRKGAYRHYGRFNSELLAHFDRTGGGAGEQFNYKLRKDGEFHATNADPMSSADFRELTEQTRSRLKEFGEAIFRGETHRNPYSYGKDKPCTFCDYRAICRIDFWTHNFRPLSGIPDDAI